ncbi:MAG: DUF177 domain-containing protein [Erysipelotrichaceae bacterium]|nr:DUF177 domain-containing protein [Erysipelotrichaceae bacterium]
MIIKRSELIKLKHQHLSPEIIFSQDDIKDVYLRRIEDLKIDIYIDEDASDMMYLHCVISGVMVCPCAITSVDVDLPFSIDENVYIDEHYEDSYQFDQELNLKALIYEIIAKEIPIKVVKSGKIDYPIGDGWKVMSETEFRNEQQNQLDPRWAKLKEYQSNEEE